MKGFRLVFLTVLVLCTATAAALACHLGIPGACDDGLTPAYFQLGDDVAKGGFLPEAIDKTRFVETMVCADLARTEAFVSSDLEYVHSSEYSDALHSVASGTSRYSPKEIPAEWNWLATAYAWGTHVAVSGSIRAESGRMPATEPAMKFGGKDACSPALLFLASLEYRAMTGHDGTRLVFPQTVRKGTQELASTIRAEVVSSVLRRNREKGAEFAEVHPSSAPVGLAVRWIHDHR